MWLLRKIINRFFIWNVTHNILLNQILILLKVDGKVVEKLNPYIQFKPQFNKTTQENAGYSLRNDINEVLEKSKLDLMMWVKNQQNEKLAILDIGCGPGMYLSLFKNNKFQLIATDINQNMIKYCQNLIPDADYYCGDFLKININKKIDFIYCIGVLIYIPPSQLKLFFNKIYILLEKNGILYLNFPHAISYTDALFKNITYVQYSPKYIRKMISEQFEIIEDRHAFDGRYIGDYDKQPYKSLNPNTHRTYKNSYLLVLKKK